MPSFDTVSEIDGHEVTNAVDQANRELGQRFDFKGTGAEYTRDAKEPFVVIMKAQVEFQLQQMLDILKLTLAKRGIDVACLEVKDPEVNLAEARQQVVLKHGGALHIDDTVPGGTPPGASFHMVLPGQPISNADATHAHPVGGEHTVGAEKK